MGSNFEQWEGFEGRIWKEEVKCATSSEELHPV